jgi:REP element-mobilizing transposase RayT
MARTKRIESGTGIYHVILRGINQQRLFEDDSDYNVFLQDLQIVKEQTGLLVYAYCLMGNHIHLLVKEGEPLSQTIKRLGVRYAYYFNTKYRRNGHLFQDRFKSVVVEDDAYFLTVLRYIYQNPVRAGICTRTDEYKWSSRRDLGKKNVHIDDTQLMEIVSLATLKREAEKLLDDVPVETRRGRRQRFSDEKAASIMLNISGAQTTSEFQQIDHAKQRGCIKRMWSDEIPIRQIARITGLSKGVVERWVK